MDQWHKIWMLMQVVKDSVGMPNVTNHIRNAALKELEQINSGKWPGAGVVTEPVPAEPELPLTTRRV